MYYRENGQLKISYRADQQIFPIRQDRILIVSLIALAALAMPFLASDYLFRAIVIPWLILALAAIGLNLLVGYCGQISLGGAAMMGVGAYAAYNLLVYAPALNFVVILIVAGAVTALVGLLFGLPSMRIHGLYLAVATLAAQFFLDWTFSRVKWVTNYSPSGAVEPATVTMLGWRIDTPVEKYLFVLAVIVAVALLAKNLVRGRIGRAWMAVRDMDTAAEVIGIRPFHTKLSAFAVSSFILGVAGALWGFFHQQSWDPSVFSIDLSLTLLFMIIIGGLGSILGAFLGTAFMIMLPIALNQIPAWIGIPISSAAIAHMEKMIFGSLIVFFLIVEPHGLARLWSIAKEKLRIWPFPY